MTTVSSKTMTINSGGSCTSNFDFGLAKTNITISGTLYDDKNGLIDGTVNGTAVGSPGGATVYAYLLDYQDKVAFKTTVNSSNGTYSFPLAEVLTDYTLLLSTANVALGTGAPAPGGWARSASTSVTLPRTRTIGIGFHSPPQMANRFTHSALAPPTASTPLPSPPNNPPSS